MIKKENKQSSYQSRKWPTGRPIDQSDVGDSLFPGVSNWQLRLIIPVSCSKYMLSIPWNWNVKFLRESLCGFYLNFIFFHIFGLALHYISDKATFSLIGLWQVIAILRKKWKLVFIYICFLSLGLLQAQFIWSFLSGLDFRISYYHLNAEKKKLFLRNILVNTLIKESITLEWKTILISIHQVCFKQWRPVCVGMGWLGNTALGTGLEFSMYFKIQIALSHGEVHVVMTRSKAVFL